MPKTTPGEWPADGYSQSTITLDGAQFGVVRLGPASTANNWRISAYVEQASDSAVTLQWFTWNASQQRWVEQDVNTGVKGDGFKMEGAGLLIASNVEGPEGNWSTIRCRWRTV